MGVLQMDARVAGTRCQMLGSTVFI